MNEKFNIFLQITEKLNKRNIIPLLMGSVGLEQVTGKDWQARDIDIHVPGDKRGWGVDQASSLDNWSDIISVMNELDYALIDLREHEFYNGETYVGYGIIDTLPHFAGIPLDKLQKHTTNQSTYYLLTAEQYVSVYRASSKDSYRADKNNHKDFEKITYLEQFIEQ